MLAAAACMAFTGIGAEKSQDALNGEWAATWQASPEAARASSASMANQTIRQIVHLSIGGSAFRVKLSNEFGDKPLTIAAAHIALSDGGSAIKPGSDRELTFFGQPTVVIPPRSRIVSDPVSLEAASTANLAVSLYLPSGAGPATEHFFAMQTAYVSPRNATQAANFDGATKLTRRLFLTGVEVAANKKTKVVVALGDALTDGFGSTIDANRRWPDFLSARLAARRGNNVSVVNAGIGGNRLLHDFIGPNALSRFDRDVISQAKVSHLIVLIGTNDFGLPGGRNLKDEEVTADEVIAGYRQLIGRAHSAGIKVIGATLTPFGELPDRPGFSSPASQAKREQVNAWIRTSKAFDAYIDFDAAIRDPANPRAILAAYDSGDHLDLNDAGYKAMADAIDLKLFN